MGGVSACFTLGHHLPPLPPSCQVPEAPKLEAVQEPPPPQGSNPFTKAPPAPSGGVQSLAKPAPAPTGPVSLGTLPTPPPHTSSYPGSYPTPPGSHPTPPGSYPTPPDSCELPHHRRNTSDTSHTGYCWALIIGHFYTTIFYTNLAYIYIYYHYPSAPSNPFLSGAGEYSSLQAETVTNKVTCAVLHIVTE